MVNMQEAGGLLLELPRLITRVYSIIPLCHITGQLSVPTSASLDTPKISLKTKPSKIQRCSAPHTPLQPRTYYPVAPSANRVYLHLVLHKIDAAVAGEGAPWLPVQNVVEISGLKLHLLGLQSYMSWLHS